jgi:archaellum component FlaC
MNQTNPTNKEKDIFLKHPLPLLCIYEEIKSLQNKVDKISHNVSLLGDNVSLLGDNVSLLGDRLDSLEKITADNTEVAVEMGKHGKHIDKIVSVLNYFENKVIPTIDSIRPKFLDNFRSSSNTLEDHNSDFD